MTYVNNNMTTDVIKYFNANPWKKNIPDCTIRAIVVAIGMKYEIVCNKFGFAWKNGYGLIRGGGVSLDDIKRVFAPYFGSVVDMNEELPEDLRDNPEIQDMLAIDAKLGIREDNMGVTLEEFLDQYEGAGSFLVGLVGNPESNGRYKNEAGDGHIVCARCLPGKPGFAIDTFDSSYMIVDSFMHIVKTVPKDDPMHWVYDKEKHCFSGYGMENA